MSDQYRHELESLSALMDSEADDLELRRVLKACDKQPELMAAWERYHLVQSILHGAARPVRPELSARIAASIAAETAPTADLQVPSATRFSAWQQNLSKIAIAASVALVFVIAVQTDFSSSSTPVLVQQDQPTAIAELPAETLLATDSTPAPLDPVAQKFLQDYLERVTISDESPVITVHVQDSPLFRLVNQLDTKQ